MIPVAMLLPIEILLQTVINKYLNTSYCVTLVLEAESSIQVIISPPFTRIDINGDDNFDEQLLEASERGCSDYIVKVSYPESFMRSFENITHVGNARRSDKKIIFLPSSEDNSDKSRFLDILSMTETGFVANVLLILPDKENSKDCTKYDLVTHHFVGPDEEVQNPHYLDKWDSCTQQFEKNVNLFPHDMSNMHGKTVKYACFTYKPYIFLDLDTPSGRDGIEVRIVDEFCRWINCTVAIVGDDNAEWGDIYPNNTGIGILGKVAEDKADITATALYSWYEYYIHLDFSAASVRTAITCIAPSPKPVASWELPLRPFRWQLWVAVLITFFITTFVFLVARKCSLQMACLTIFGMMINQTHSDSRNWRVRRVTVWLLVTALVLTNAYSAGLASTFTVPKYEQSIDTIQDVVDRSVEWGATHDAWIYSLLFSQDPIILQLIKQFRTYGPEELKRRSFLGQMAFGIERLPAGHFAIGEYITKEAATNLMILLEDFYYEYNVVMLRKSSCFTNKMSELIGRLHASGLLLAWETQVSLSHLDNKVQLEVKLSRSFRSNEVVPLSFRQVIGSFYLYLLGVIISITVFIAELLIMRRQKVHKM